MDNRYTNWIKDYLKIMTWNIRGITSKLMEMKIITKRMKLDTALLRETKKRLWRTTHRRMDIIYYYSDVDTRHG